MNDQEKEYVVLKYFDNQEVESRCFSTYDEAVREFEKFTGVNQEFFNFLKKCAPFLVRDFRGTDILECKVRMIE
ncbi:MAG: hypothetical protein AMS17_09840 [Spirochaetes bacterium DG_61]|nr:MAG: hypothetical protein AMS17_09840 [Spirochaetes bacterium DG_61]